MPAPEFHGLTDDQLVERFKELQKAVLESEGAVTSASMSGASTTIRNPANLYRDYNRTLAELKRRAVSGYEDATPYPGSHTMLHSNG